MNQQTNGPAWVSLGVGIGAIVLAATAVFVSSIPVLHLLAGVVLGLQAVASFAAIVAGIVGWRTSAALYGVGKGRSMTGFLLGVAGLVLRLGIWIFGLA